MEYKVEVEVEVEEEGIKKKKKKKIKKRKLMIIDLEGLNHIKNLKPSGFPYTPKFVSPELEKLSEGELTPEQIDVKKNAAWQLSVLYLDIIHKKGPLERSCLSAIDPLERLIHQGLSRNPQDRPSLSEIIKAIKERGQRSAAIAA